MNAGATIRTSWSEWLRAEASHGVFVLRTVVGILLALAIAFRLDLSTPGSAAVTVSIIALPQTGQVLEKSFYRLLGTLLGAVVTLMLLANLVQHRDTFIGAVALWIGLCTAASSWFRGFQAYGWLLCGYTTCLIGFPAFMDAGHAFEIAVDRVTIVGVGILSAGLVNTVILPSRSTTSLVQQVRRSFADFVAFLDATTVAGGAARIHAIQHQFSRDLAALETTRASSVFEDPASRIRSRRLFGFIGGFMSSSTRLQLLHRQLNWLQNEGRHDVLAAVEPQLQQMRGAFRLRDSLPGTALDAAPVVDRLDGVLDEWRAVPSEGASSAALTITRTLIREAGEGARSLTQSFANLHSLRNRTAMPQVRPHFHSDVLQAAVAGIRAIILVFVTCAFWIATAWPEGFSMTFLAVVGCALFSSAPNPARAALQMCKGFALAVPALLVCYTWVLPSASDFTLLTLGLLPFLIFGAWLMTRPGQILVGSGFFLMYLTALNLTGVMSYDFVALINNLVALLVGIGVATLSLAVLVPADRAWRPQRAEQLLLASLVLARDDRLEGLALRFESRVRDLTLQLMALRSPDDRRESDESLGIVILGAGAAIIRLREIADRSNDPRAAKVAGWIASLVDAMRRRDAAALTALDADVAHAVRDESANDTVSPLPVGLAILRLAIADCRVGVAHAA